MTKMNKKLQNQITSFYIISSLQACFFATANWYFLWKLFLTNGGIGIVDGLCFTVGLLVEIPSGAIADIFGRKKTLMIAVVLMGIGYMITGFAVAGSMILAGYMIYSIGSAFYSGSDDALMYDHLKENKQEGAWKQIVTTKNIYARIAALTATLLGGFLFAYNFRLPAITRGLFFLLMLIPLMILPENYGKENPEKTFKNYLSHIVDGLRQLLIPSIAKLLPLFVILGSVVGTMYVGGLLRPLLLAKAGFNGVTQSYIITFAGVLTAIALWIYKKNLDKISDTLAIWLMTIVTVLCFSLMGLLAPAYWLLMLILIQSIQGLFIPTVSDLVNHQIPSTHRATTLSALSLTQSIPYVIAAPIIGILADRSDYSAITWGITGLIMLAILASFYLSFVRTKK